MDKARAVVTALRSWLAAADDRPWVVETSGSTGRPKRVMLSRAAVRASIAASAARVGAQGRWLLALPASYVAGVNVITRSLAAGHEPVLLEEQPSFGEAVDALHASDVPTFLSVVPTQLIRLLDTDADALRTFHTILLGGGPVDASLRTRAREAGLRVVSTYGSAETSGGCVYDGLPLDGVQLGLLDPDDSGAGRVRIGGPTLFAGYEDEPALTAQALVDGWFLTSDAGRIGPDGRLQVIGRVDDMVVTGGVNVPAPAVAARLREHASVQAAEVLGVPDPEWGNRLVAYVVRHGAAATPDLAELRDWVSAMHPRAWAPRQLEVLDEMPLLANGKPDRLALRALVLGGPGAERAREHSGLHSPSTPGTK